MIGPIAKSIKCLESAHTTVADVFIFYVAFMAEIDDLSKSNKLILLLSVMADIRHLCNKRFNQMINEAPSDIFITGFFLVPSKNVTPHGLSALSCTYILTPYVPPDCSYRTMIALLDLLLSRYLAATSCSHTFLNRMMFARSHDHTALSL